MIIGFAAKSFSWGQGLGCGEVGKWESFLITLSPQNPITLSPASCLPTPDS
ncbi:hypothetical protein VL20_1382 [Microcystis panniformis FACHB-1757]|uniref:Uncharacterized protein n=1 Tax=Microcystis panniformis FACHB-1757 TaxID=1638788 RepID=A0A0K1RXP0_9CHRO|nr:hypothetical protein VL20_1382 [Microcystis panniformis FACHB-1757]